MAERLWSPPGGRQQMWSLMLFHWSAYGCVQVHSTDVMVSLTISSAATMNVFATYLWVGIMVERYGIWLRNYHVKIPSWDWTFLQEPLITDTRHLVILLGSEMEILTLSDWSEKQSPMCTQFVRYSSNNIISLFHPLHRYALSVSCAFSCMLFIGVL